jgi:hypothetical protein
VLSLRVSCGRGTSSPSSEGVVIRPHPRGIVGSQPRCPRWQGRCRCPGSARRSTPCCGGHLPALRRGPRKQLDRPGWLRPHPRGRPGSRPAHQRDRSPAGRHRRGAPDRRRDDDCPAVRAPISPPNAGTTGSTGTGREGPHPETVTAWEVAVSHVRSGAGTVRLASSR